MCIYIYFYIKYSYMYICVYVCVCNRKSVKDLTVHIAHAKQWENVQQLIRKMVRGVGYGVTRLKKEESHHLKDWISRILSKNIQGLIII